ncbi:MAG TPA: hypothetical protein VIH59_24150 [Candidatus Tectomicrobia bacterium]|jgi:hypothetical protein
MREFTKATLSFPWALSLFGVEQLANVLLPQHSAPAGAAFDAVTQATGAQLSELMQGLFLLGNTVQRETTDWACSLLTPGAFNPQSRATAELVQQSTELFRSLNPLQGGTLTLQELQNKAQVFSLVRAIPGTLQLPAEPPYAPLLEVVQRAYALEPYSTLWAVEGIGHWYGDTVFTRQAVPQGILTEASVRELPAASLTMLHAGMGMSFAQHWLQTVNHLSSRTAVRQALEQILTLCRDNSRPGYTGAALESLGLITQNGQFYREMRPDEMVQMVSRELAEMDQEAFAYFWHGVGRAHYFLPIHFVPGYGSIWHAVRMVQRAAPNRLAWLNAIAGLSWAVTLVNIRHPQVVVNFVHYHGTSLAADDGFANGVASSLMMRYDTTPGAPFIVPFYQYQPDPGHGASAQLWDGLVRLPAHVALQEYYPVLQHYGCLGEIFRYQALPALMAQLQSGATRRR